MLGDDDEGYAEGIIMDNFRTYFVVWLDIVKVRKHIGGSRGSAQKPQTCSLHKIADVPYLKNLKPRGAKHFKCTFSKEDHFCREVRITRGKHNKEATLCLYQSCKWAPPESKRVNQHN